MGKSIRSELMEKLGIDKDEVEKLISMYSKQHVGRVHSTQIISDVEKISTSMIQNVGYLFKGYDVGHEMIDCGKDRQEDGIMSLLSEEEQKLALQYLPNRYAENVNTWVLTFYKAAQKQLLEVLNGKIDSYRQFVDNLPYKNINRVAKTFGIESDIAAYIAENGKEEDFQQFMTDVQPSLKDKGLDRKSCPKDLCKKIFKKLQEEMKEKGVVTFNRDFLMRGLSTVHNMEELNESEKEELQDIFISHFLQNGVDSDFVKLARVDLPQKYDVLKKYLNLDSNVTRNEKEQFLEDNILPAKRTLMQDAYSELVANILKKVDSKEFTPKEIVEMIRESKLSNNGLNEIYLSQDEDEKKSKLTVYIAHPVLRGETLSIDIDGTILSGIINNINTQSKSKANEELEEYAQKGIEEVSLLRNWSMDMRFEYSDEMVLGVLADDDNSPYVTAGGKHSLNGMQVNCPYPKINNHRLFLEYGIEKMSPEQISAFNRENKVIDIQYHSYTYPTVEEIKKSVVADFVINEDNYHLEESDYYTRHSYLELWIGDEEKYPETAMGITGDWNRDAEVFAWGSTEIADIVNFINKNPNRFLKLYNELKGKCNCNGFFPVCSISDLRYRIMSMQPESIIKNMNNKDLAIDESQRQDNNERVGEQVNISEKSEELFEEITAQFEKEADLKRQLAIRDGKINSIE